MIRREFLSQMALAGTLAGTVPELLWATTLTRSTPPPHSRTPGEVYAAPLNLSQISFLAAVGEKIIPATDTGGATAAGVAPFIGFLYSDWLLAAEQAAFAQGLAGLEADCRKAHGKSFEACTSEQQDASLTTWDAQAYEPRPHDVAPPFFRRLKELVIVGYYTSPVGQDIELKIRFGGGQGEPDGPAMSSPPFVHI
jgi:gluconate 2-dehydrogenase gamma chain